MDCQKCGKPTLIVEDLGGGKKKLHCSSCGLNEIKDGQGRKMLTETMPLGQNVLVGTMDEGNLSRPARKLLTEG
jgi:hypothetical protein